MKKKVFGRKLSRSRPAREALFASLIRGMLLGGKLTTTKAKAKSIQGELERMVTVAKKGELSGRRRVLASLDNATDALEALYKQVVPSMTKRTSGYTRLISLPPRKGDRAPLVRMEWTEVLTEVKKEVKPDKKAKTENKDVPKKGSKVGKETATVRSESKK